MAKCSKCGAELIDLFTSKNVCPNNCSAGGSGKTEECGCGAIIIDGVHCFRDAIGIALTNVRSDDVHINADEISDVYNAIKAMMKPLFKHSRTTAFSISKPNPVTFEYFKEGHSIRISYGQSTDVYRNIFHVFFQDDVVEFMKFLSP